MHEAEVQRTFISRFETYHESEQYKAQLLLELSAVAAARHPFFSFKIFDIIYRFLG